MRLARNMSCPSLDQNFDSYSVEYTFADGAKFFLEGRTMPGCHNEFASYAHGSRGSAVISISGHHPARCRIHRPAPGCGTAWHRVPRPPGEPTLNEASTCAFLTALE